MRTPAVLSLVESHHFVVTLFVTCKAHLLYKEELFKQLLRDNSGFGLVLVRLLTNILDSW